jgi:hypothetical protein
MVTRFFSSRTLTQSLLAVGLALFALCSMPARAIIDSVTPSTVNTPITPTGTVNFTYTTQTGSVLDGSFEVYICLGLNDVTKQVGGAFPSGPTPLSPASFCSGQLLVPPLASDSITVVEGTPTNELFPMDAATYTTLQGSVGLYGIVYFVRAFFDEFTPSRQTFTVSRLQLSRTIVASADTVAVVGGNSANVLANDTVGGAAATTANAIVSIVSNGGIAGLSVVSGQLLVPTNTNAGSYPVSYRICDAAPGGSANCSTATATLNVTASANPLADSATVPSTTTTAVTVLGNDTIGGTAASTANGIITLVAPLPIAGLTVNGTGQIVVPPSTPGAYSITYQLCNAAATTVCAAAVLSLTVSTPVLVANADSASLPATGGTVAVLANDTIDGVAATAGNVTVTIQNAGGLTGLTVNGAGAVVVPANPGGTYPVTYRICAVSSPTTCVNGTATVTVASTIVAVNDTATLPGAGGTVPVLANDTLNGLPATTSNVAVTVVSNGGLTGLSVVAGALSVTANPANTYVVSYRICELASPANCANATATITINALVLVANNDVASLTTTGGTVNVLGNDTIGGNVATISNVTVAIVSAGGLTGLSIDASGALVVPTNLPGNYAVTYRVCDRITVTNCANATATITIGSVAVTAGNDAANFSTTAGGTVSVMTNDTVGGVGATTTNSSRTVLSNGGITGLAFNVAGQLVVPPFAAGVYSASYQICAALVPSSCASATVTITMTPTLTALSDSAELTTAGGVVTVLANDRVDAAAATSANVAVSITNYDGLGGIAINSASALVVPPSNPGRYRVAYRICSLAVPAACANSEVTILLVVGISAVADTITLPNAGGDADVLANDQISGVRATAANVTLTIVSAGGLTGLTVTTDARIRVPAGNTPGSYAVNYRICSIGASPVCATAIATITIGAPSVVAQPDTITLPSAGGRATVLDNDTYNGAAATNSNVTLEITAAGGLTGLTVDAGAIVVPASTPGSYSVTYRICALPPSATTCSSTTAAITVAAPLVVPATDRIALPDTGGVLRVLANDLIAGVPATAANAIVSIVNNGGLDGLKVNDAGELVLPSAPAGTYTITYRVCARAAPTTCADGTVVLTVSIGTLAIKLVDDVIVAGQLGAAFNVLANDQLGGKPVLYSAVNLTLVNNASLSALALAGSGVLTIPPASPGVYVATYRLCQKNLPANCAEAKARITVTQGQGVGETARRRPPSVPGATTATYTLTPGTNSPIIFSQAIPSSAGAANSPLILGETRLGYGSTSAGVRFQSYRSDSEFEPFGAQFQYSGTGTLNYRWEIVRPGDSQPDVIDLYPEPSLSVTDRLRQTRYTEISRGQVFLPAMGRYFMRGPDPSSLPRTDEGTYLILLRIEASTASVSGGLNGATAFPIQPLTYVMVGDRGITTTDPIDPRDPAAAAAAAARRRLTGGSSVAEFSNMGQLPDAGPGLNNGALRFRQIAEPWKSLQPKTIELIGASIRENQSIALSWKPAAEVVIYRLFVESRAPTPASSLVVVVKPGTESGYELKASALQSFTKPGEQSPLRWRIVAYAADGKIVAMSDWSPLKR